MAKKADDTKRYESPMLCRFDDGEDDKSRSVVGDEIGFSVMISLPSAFI